MKSSNYHLVHILVIPILFSLILYNSNFSGEGDKNNNEYYFLSLNFLQNSYAIESDEKDENNNNNNDSKETKEEEEDESENNKGKSIFNIVAVGDWDCTSETEDTVDNIIKQDPEFVLALGDLSYNGKAKCWLELIEPIAEKTKIVIGNHEVDSSKLRKDYMNYFGLENQYYSFNQKNVHFLALSTETCF